MHCKLNNMGMILSITEAVMLMYSIGESSCSFLALWHTWQDVHRRSTPEHHRNDLCTTPISQTNLLLLRCALIWDRGDTYLDNSAERDGWMGAPTDLLLLAKNCYRCQYWLNEEIGFLCAPEQLTSVQQTDSHLGVTSHHFKLFVFVYLKCNSYLHTWKCNAHVCVFHGSRILICIQEVIYVPNHLCWFYLCWFSD